MNHNTGRASKRMPDTRWTINMGVIAVFVCILEITVHVLNYSQPPLSVSSTSTDSTKHRPKILKKKKKKFRKFERANLEFVTGWQLFT